MRGHGSALAAVGTVLALTVAGCSSGDGGGDGGDPDGAQRLAERLADGLAAGKLRGLPFRATDGAQAQRRWEETAGDLADRPREVRLVRLAERADGTAATATLGYTWELGARDWSYRTSAHLTRASGRWLVRFDPALVEPSLEEGERLDAVALPAARGDILGDGGARLVTERPVLRFGIDKTRVAGGPAARSARRLADLLGIDAASLAERVRAAGDQAFVEAIVLRTGDVTGEVRRGLDRIPGARAIPDEMPLAPTREFARPILGSVGPATAEIIEESDGRYQVGDEVGLSGLQQRYEETLAGSPGMVVRAEDGDSGATRQLFRVGPTPGEPLRTSLDPRLQALAERVLADVGPASAIVALRPSDGDIVAAASGPGSGGYSTATVGRYAPGSTFKVVSSLALLRAGLRPDSTVPCTDTVTVDGRSFENYDDYPPGAVGDIPLRTALANSCNTAFIAERERVPQERLAEAAAALGLGVDHDLGFPAYFGSVPAEATGTEHAASMIGQGKVLASPMAMATVVASVAAGHTVVPRLLVGDEEDGASPEVPLTDAEAARLRDLMRGVVTDGSASFLADLPGPPVLAKTGTAEFGTTVPPRTHAWMVAVHGDLAVAVFVEEGASGSHTAGPLLEEFLRAAR